MRKRPWHNRKNLIKLSADISLACLARYPGVFDKKPVHLPVSYKEESAAIFWRYINLGQADAQRASQILHIIGGPIVGAWTPDPDKSAFRAVALALEAITDELHAEHLHAASAVIDQGEVALGDKVVENLEMKWRVHDAIGGALPGVTPELIDAFAAAWSVGEHDYADNMAREYVSRRRRK